MWWVLLWRILLCWRELAQGALGWVWAVKGCFAVCFVGVCRGEQRGLSFWQGMYETVAEVNIAPACGHVRVEVFCARRLR